MSDLFVYVIGVSVVINAFINAAFVASLVSQKKGGFLKHFGRSNEDF